MKLLFATLGAHLAGITFLFLPSHAPAGAPAQETATMRDAIESEVRKATGGGKLEILDARSGEVRSLTLVKVHDTAHVTQDGSAFACVDFKDAAGKIYDVDAFVTVGDTYRLQELLLHKMDGKDRIREPEGAQPPAPATASKVRGAIDGWMKRESVLRGGLFPLYDPRAGQVVAGKVELVHQGVHKSGDGLYYACVDVRVEGKLYDVDVYVRPVREDFEIAELLVHKVDGKDRLR